MLTKRTPASLALALSLTLSALASAGAQELGTITFPTSGAPAAQEPFLQGVKQLHSFQFDEAAESFRRARELDAGFAMAYWGEAMSHNHPLWAQQDAAAAKAVLEQLAPTPEGRLAKAELPKEKAYLEAIHALYYAPGDKLARDRAYSEALARMHERWPDDHEIATFYALSLLGTVRPGDTGFRRQALAASIVQKVFDENPKHPGAAHFIIHAFDDPDHAILALPAAEVYATIAPAAAHALHMPSHIFLQLGLWDGVKASNIDAYKAAVDLNERMNLPEGREDFHTLSWLLYANLMLGRFGEAEENLALAKAAADRNPDSRGIANGYLGMRARYILETGAWEEIPVGEQTPDHGGSHADMPGMASMPGMAAAPDGSATWTFIAGVSAAKRGDLETAGRAEAQLRAMRERLAGGENAYRAKPVQIMEHELAAVAHQAKGNLEEALRAARAAVDVELTLSAPSGPPEPIKPALELYGEILLDADRPGEAAEAFEQALLRTPKRTPSLLGLARAATALGDTVTAREAYSELAAMKGAAPDAPAVQEAQKFLQTSME